MADFPPQMNRADWIMLVLLSVLWGGSFFFIGVAVTGLPAFTIVTTRVILAALVLLLVLRFVGLSMPRDRRVWSALITMGVLNNVIPFCLIVWGQMHIASGLAAILNATTPVFTVIVAHLATRDERIRPHKLVGVLLGFLGVAYLVGKGALEGFGGNLWAELAVIAAAFSYALAGVFGRRFSRLGVRPLQTATGQLMSAALLMTPVMLLVDRPWLLPAPGVPVVLAVVALAVVSTALAYILYFKLLESAGATNLLLVTFLIPVSAILLGVWFLDESLAARHLVGMALIGAGLLAIDGRLLAGRNR